MDWPNFARRLLLDDGRITDVETALLRRAMPATDRLDRDEVAFLVRLKHEATSTHPSFDEFLFHVLCRVVLADGFISDPEALWLRGIVLRDGHSTEAGRRFVTRLKAEAQRTGPEFDRLHDDVMRARPADLWG
jgi:hypothetical protein